MPILTLSSTHIMKTKLFPNSIQNSERTSHPRKKVGSEFLATRNKNGLIEFIEKNLSRKKQILDFTGMTIKQYS